MKTPSLVILAALLFCACDNNSKFEDKKEEPVKTAVEEKQEVPAVREASAVCLLENLSVRAEPNASGKWLTSMSLGEVITFTGVKAVDTVKNHSYSKVRLADNKEGWTRSDFIEVNGTVSVFRNDADVYKRPDLLTKTNKKYSIMDIVAIIDKQGEWAQVKGKRTQGKYLETGWVKISNLSTESVDIAVAKFGKAALAEEDTDKKIKKLKSVLDNSDLSSSSFIPAIQSELTDMEEALQAEAVDLGTTEEDAVSPGIPVSKSNEEQ